MAKSKIWILLLLIIVGNVWYVSNRPDINFNFFIKKFNFDKYFHSNTEKKLSVTNINSDRNEIFVSTTEWKNIDKDYLKKDFHTFLSKFGSDTHFQTNSIKFPLTYIVDDPFEDRPVVYNTIKQWKEERIDTLVYNTYNYLSETLRKEFITEDSVNVIFGIYIQELHKGDEELKLRKQPISDEEIVYMERKTIFKFKKISKKWTLLEIQEAFQEVENSGRAKLKEWQF